MVSPSQQLAQAHQQLRRRLDEVRTALGHRRPGHDALLTHCLTFCAALGAHHQDEDDDVFTRLQRVYPELEPTIAKLVEDHVLIAAILSQVRELADGAAAADGAVLEAVGRELDGLAAIMESHFRYEERAIGAALDGVSSRP